MNLSKETEVKKMPEIIRSKMVKARKKYLCDYSRKVISIGENYQRNVVIGDGEIYTWRISEKALYIIEKLGLYSKGTNDDGFGAEDYEELLKDYLDENNLYDEFKISCIPMHQFVYYKLKVNELK